MLRILIDTSVKKTARGLGERGNSTLLAADINCALLSAQSLPKCITSGRGQIIIIMLLLTNKTNVKSGLPKPNGARLAVS